MVKRKKLATFLLVVFGCIASQINAQTTSTSSNLIAQPVVDRTVPFDVSASGISKSVEFGADLAWINAQHFRRNILFMGLDQIDIVRASFQPTYALIGDTALTQAQIDDLDYRIWLINNYVGSNVDLTLNCDHPFVDSYYLGNPERWHKLIKVSKERFESAGHNVITVGAFNEPDYGWGQGSSGDMYNITSLLNADPSFSGVRLSGGNTLSNDEAQWWYDMLIPAGVTEGNTHQLAGSFDTFASFLQSVRANGHHATLDELHNIVEGLVGYEYGMHTGIWWADIDLASGEMVKAFDGERLAYAEHRANWTAAAVYRAPDGKVQAFGGTSERQAVTTTYNYLSKDRAVYYDGHGPQREFVLEMPGGTGYMNGQTNAERVVNITWGEDIQPSIDGNYVLVNRNSGLVLQVPGGSKKNTNIDGANVNQGTYAGNTYQEWTVQPVDSRFGGDFSYYWISPLSNTAMALELSSYNLDNGANIEQWTTTDSYGGNTQWYLDYAEDGWFYIRSRESSKCLDVWGAGTSDGDNICQWEKNGGYSQQWRLIPVGAPIEFTAPSAPTNLMATAQTASVKLNWTASPEGDVAGYSIFRAESAGGTYNTIARNVAATSFVDNTTTAGLNYYYKIKAVDNSLNRSSYSNEVSAAATGANDLIANYSFEGSTNDISMNMNHAAAFNSGVSYSTGHSGSAVTLDGASGFVQLPSTLPHHTEITIAAWVYWNGSTAGYQQRIFDFGNGTDEYMFLSPNGNGNGNMRFAISNGSWWSEQGVDVPELTSGEWKHVALTLGAAGAKIYVDGSMVGENTSVTLNPMDIKPLLNYIGRSQFNTDAYFDGSIDDFKIYNYALSDTEIANLASGITCEPSVITPYYQINYGTWVIGTEISINEGDFLMFGPQPVTGGSWNWSGCGTSGTSREQGVFLTNSCSPTATYTNDCGSQSVVTYNVTVIPAIQPSPSIATAIESASVAAEEKVNIQAYPNPVAKQLWVKVNNYKGDVTVEIFGVDGRLKQKVVESIGMSGKISIARWSYTGFAIVKVTAGENVEAFKITF